MSDELANFDTRVNTVEQWRNLALAPSGSVEVYRRESLVNKLLMERQKASASTFDQRFVDWICEDRKPNAFVTLLMPHVDRPGSRSAIQYLSRWTIGAERTLFGASVTRITNLEDRCVWVAVPETITQLFNKAKGNTPQRFHHVHALATIPRRPLLVERREGTSLTDTQRCALLEKALITASRHTPEVYADSDFDKLRGADVKVDAVLDNASRAAHAAYLLKQMTPKHSDHWQEKLEGNLLRDHGLVYLPNI